MKNTLSKTQTNRSFTLIEIIIVTILIGVLASLAIVQYNQTYESRLAFATMMNLRTIYAATKIRVCRQGMSPPNGAPLPPGVDSLNAINTLLGLQIVDTNSVYTAGNWLAVAWRPKYMGGSNYFLIVDLTKPLGTTNPWCIPDQQPCPANVPSAYSITPPDSYLQQMEY